MNHVIELNRSEPINRTAFARRAWFVVKAWLQDPLNVATICPSSPFLTEHLANRDCVQQAERIIELGPGAGGTTQALLSNMRHDAEMLAVEVTEAFAEALDAINDPRLKVAIADASDLVDLVTDHNLGQADVVISGIPFSSIPEPVARKITQSIYEVLRPGGVFIAYQLRSDVTDYARPLFGPAKTESIPINLPPLTAFVWTKVCGPPQGDDHGSDNNGSR
ncbi:class I SAM-dependent methyltransferase [Neorhodopirellula lusitana]|nr:methyltransferase domain-containing protein [Neorhodopirellula lusitana]